jgi:hypothetical protein
MAQFVQQLIMDTTLYVGHSSFNPNGFRLEARDIQTGQEIYAWPTESDAQLLNEMTSNLSWRFQGRDGFIYLPGQGGLYAIRIADRQLAWRCDINALTSPLLPVHLAV